HRASAPRSRGGSPRWPRRPNVDRRFYVDQPSRRRYTEDHEGTMAITNSGLEGVVVADTAISDVDGEHGKLVIAGADVERLAGGRRRAGAPARGAARERARSGARPRGR